MLKDDGPFTMQKMAAMLELRKNINHPTVLLLGARAGALFRSENFFRALGRVSSRDLNLYPRTEPFSECYSILANGGFSEAEIHSIFRASFEKLSITRFDRYLAELVKQGHFVEIICTNIDNLLELSFTEVGMKEHADFEVVSSYADFLRESSLTTGSLTRVSKVFGDFSSRNYTLNRYLSNADGKQEYMSALQRVLAKDILLFGIDPKWDKHILDAIPLNAMPGVPRPGTVWLVSEEDLTRHETVAGILRQRQSQSIIGREGQLDYFFISLYNHLNTDAPLNYQIARNISTSLDEVSGQLISASHQLVEILQKIQDLQERVLELQDDHKKILDEVKNIQMKVDKFSQGEQ